MRSYIHSFSPTLIHSTLTLDISFKHFHFIWNCEWELLILHLELNFCVFHHFHATWNIHLNFDRMRMRMRLYTLLFFSQSSYLFLTSHFITTTPTEIQVWCIFHSQCFCIQIPRGARLPIWLCTDLNFPKEEIIVVNSNAPFYFRFFCKFQI